MSAKDEKNNFDILEHMRRPHGLLILAILVGIVAWGLWTLWTARV